ncbi:RNA-binding protein [Tritrichomonas foetus]|uniref:RNA-binding protein n=1 Tax=Tritrichomonas foetus TaxID=1144522 RepID=A0A1J4JCH2_9EUKA|nr:RNA-binding protein [Tritrichomonas foetus]|eukprot:OHS96898.1 RNA-binding protein [Tritrichomonas foetus]
MSVELDPNTVFVQNIPYVAETEELQNAFAAFGEIKSCRVLKERYHGELVSKGIGFVEFAAADSVAKATAGPVSIRNRQLRVTQARKRTERKRDTAFVSNIPEGSTVDDLKAAFSNYHPVDGRIVRTNGPNGRGFAFVKFATSEDQDKAVKDNRTLQFKGEESHVIYARRDFDAPPRRRFIRRRRFNRRGGRRAIKNTQ